MHPFLPVLLVLASASASPQATASGTKAKVDAIFREVDHSDTPGCALGVYRDGEIAYARGYGMANLELAVGNTPQTVFDIGSVSKQFTAFAIHLLAREGKLSLDDDIRKWVPEVPSYGKTVTLRHLLHHTGGLRDYIELLGFQGVVEEDLTGDAEVLEVMARQKAPNFAPGEDYVYCNTGYNLLSMVVRKASGQSLRDFAAKRIFEPLGMSHTQFNDAHTRIIPNRATGYQKLAGGEYGIEMSDWEQTGDGAVLTTVEDLFLWNQNFFEPKVGDAKLLADMQTVEVLNNGQKLKYASALQLGTYRGLPTVSHSGSWVGYRAQLLRFPEQKFAVACLCNDGGVSNPSELSRKVAEVYLAGVMKSEETARAARGRAPAKYAASAAELQRWTGAYLGRDTGRIVRVSADGKGLVAETGSEKLILQPSAPGRFLVEGARDQAEVQFDPAAGGRPVMRVKTGDLDDRETEVFDPVGMASPGAAELAELVGSYVSEELATTWLLAVENGKLYIRHRGLSKDPLVPTVKDAMNLDGMNLRFHRGAGGKVTGFTLDMGRVRGIAFQKL